MDEDYLDLRKKAEKTLSRALEYESLGHLEVASQSYVKYSYYLMQLEKEDEAIKYLEVADALYPIPLEARASLAELYYKSNQLEKAENEYSDIINLYAQQGLYSSAVDLCQKYIEMIPSSSNLKYELANLYLQSDRTQKAINIFLEIVNIGVDSEKALEKLGDIYTRRNSIKEAISSYIKAAELYTKRSKLSQALKQYRNILRLKPDSLSIRKKLIEVLYKLNKKDELVNELLILARDLKNKGKEKIALSTYSKVLQFDPSNEIALNSLGAKLKVRKSREEIEKIFSGDMSLEVSESLQSILKELVGDEDIKSKTLDSKTHYDMGIAYMEMDLFDEAIHEFQLASKDPELKVRACNLLGTIFLEMGESNLAIKELERGLKSYGDEEEHLGLRYNLAMAYKRKGEFEKSLNQLEEIYIVDIEYLDVKEQIEELKSSLNEDDMSVSDEYKKDTENH